MIRSGTETPAQARLRGPTRETCRDVNNPPRPVVVTRGADVRSQVARRRCRQPYVEISPPSPRGRAAGDAGQVAVPPEGGRRWSPFQATSSELRVEGAAPNSLRDAVPQRRRQRMSQTPTPSTKEAWEKPGSSMSDWCMRHAGASRRIGEFADLPGSWPPAPRRSAVGRPPLYM